MNWLRQMKPPRLRRCWGTCAHERKRNGKPNAHQTEPSVWSAIYNAENRPVRRQIEVLFQGIIRHISHCDTCIRCVARCLPRRGEETIKPLKSIGTANGQTFFISAPSSPTSASSPPSTAPSAPHYRPTPQKETSRLHLTPSTSPFDLSPLNRSKNPGQG